MEDTFFDEIMDGGVTPESRAVSSSTDWCENCRILRKERDQLKEEHTRNYTALKQKIISTDLLIKKYGAKCQECDALNKSLEDVALKKDKLLQENNTLQEQLKLALLDVEPLRKALQRQLDVEQKDKMEKLNKYEVENDNLKEQLKDLQNRLDGWSLGVK